MLVMLAGVSNTATAVSLDESIQPIALTLHQNPARADIGRLLFHDPRLSGNGRLSCASCHDTGKGGADGRARSVGQNGGQSEVNTPTVLISRSRASFHAPLGSPRNSQWARRCSPTAQTPG